MAHNTASWMPLYVADYLADTSHLSTEEHGAYLLLIMHYWRTGQPLPADPAQLRRIVRADQKQWARISGAVLPFFVAEAGVYRHKRIDGELAKAAKKSTERSASGKAGASARWSSGDGKRMANASDCDGSAMPEPLANAKQTDAPSPSPTQTQDIPKATPSGADAPLTVADLANMMWREGVKLLTARGSSERNARSVLGKWSRDHGPPAVIQALAAAQGSPDPVPFIEAFFRERRTDKRPDRITADFASAARRIVADGVRDGAGALAPPADADAA